MAITRGDIQAWYPLQRDKRDILKQQDASTGDGVATLETNSPISNHIGSTDFNDSASYNKPNFNVLDGEFGIAAWVKTTDNSSTQQISDKNDNTSNNEYRFETQNGLIGFHADGATRVEGSDISDGNWHHVVATRDSNDNLELYLDGSLEASTTYTTDRTTNQPAHIGGSTFFSTGYWTGNIAQLIHTSSYIGNDVSTLYNGGDGITARAQFPLTDNLEAYYKLDGNADDATGNGNDGTVNGATVTSPGRIGDAYSFDGNDKIEIPHNSTWEISETGSWAFGFWAKTTDTGNVVIWEKNGNSGWSIQQEGDNTIKMNLGGTDDADQLQTNTSINDGNWHHVVFTLDNGTGRVYIDGEDKTTSQPGGATPTYGTEPTYIGSRNTSVGFVGDLDEMFFRTESMTQGEARRLYSYGAGLRYEDLDKENPLNDGVVGAWTFDSLEGAKNNTYPLQNNGATQTTGKLSDAYDTQGSTSTYLKTQDNIGVSGSEARTVATWFNLQAVNDNKGHIVNWGNTGVDGESYGFFHLNAPDNNLNFFGWGGTEDYDTNYDIPTDEWVNAVATYDGSIVETYTNGTETAVSNQSRSLNTLDTEVFFGQRMDVQSASHFDGLIDFSCVWSRDLAVTEVNEFDNDGNGQQFPYGLQTSITAITQSFNYQFTPQAITALPGTTAQPLDYTYTAQPSTISIITTASPFNYRYYQAVEPVRLFGAAGNIIITGRNT